MSGHPAEPRGGAAPPGSQRSQREAGTGSSEAASEVRGTDPDGAKGSSRPRRLGPAVLLDGATQALNVAGSLLILGLMLLIGADVIGRGLLGRPIAGVPEIVTLSIVAIVFLQIPAAFRAGRLTRSDALLGWLRREAPRAAAGLEAVFDLAAIVVVAVIVRATWPLLSEAWREGHFVGSIGNFTAPTWPVKAAVVLGGALLIAQLVRRLVAGLRDAAR